MKRYILLFALLCSFAAVPAQKLSKDVTDTRQSVATILVYRQGVLQGSGTAVFVNGNGEILTDYSLLSGADSAVTIDPSGKVRRVERILGVNEMFNCVRARVAWDRKIKPLQISSTATPVGSELYMVSYGVKKSGVITPLTVTAVDSVYSSAYYTFKHRMKEQYLSLPLVNGEGELVAIMQPTSARDTINSYAAGLSFVPSLEPSSLNYGRGYYARMGIRTAIPATKEVALSCLYMQAMVGDSLSYRATVDDFIVAFPREYEGYLARAEYEAVYLRDMNLAEESWKKALSLADNDSEVYFGKGKVIYSIVQSGDSLSSPLLTYDNAMEAVNQAIETDNQPIYTAYKADMLLSRGMLSEAAVCYESMSGTVMRSADYFAKAANCRFMLKEYDAAIALLDSAVCFYQGSDDKASAQYILTRALVKLTAEKYRDAVFDYNKYEEIMSGSLSAAFYYLRSQAELSAKMYQQALSDLDNAIYLSPQDPLYYVDKALLCYRVKLTDEGIRSLEAALKFAPDNADVHYLLGRLYIQAEEKAKAREAFEKASALGHSEAAAALEGMDE